MQVGVCVDPLVDALPVNFGHEKSDDLMTVGRRSSRHVSRDLTLPGPIFRLIAVERKRGLRLEFLLALYWLPLIDESVEEAFELLIRHHDWLRHIGCRDVGSDRIRRERYGPGVSVSVKGNGDVTSSGSPIKSSRSRRPYPRITAIR